MRNSPHRILFAICIATTLLWGDSLWAETDRHRSRHEFSQILMGMEFKLVFYAADEALAKQAAKAAFDRVAELNAVLSDYDPQSELSRLSQSAGEHHPVPVSRDLWPVLERAQDLNTQSGGAFDITIGPLTRLWRRARRERQMPSNARRTQAMNLVGPQLIELDADRRTVLLRRSGMRLDLGGIGAGFAADEAFRTLHAHGLNEALVDASGDVVVGNPPPGESGWRIGIEAGTRRADLPLVFVRLARQAIATSGDTQQYVELDGKRYSHLVDPKTGLGLIHRRSVTVIADDGISADSLATAISVMDIEKGLALIARTPHAECLIVQTEDAGTVRHESPGFAKYVVSPEAK